MMKRLYFLLFVFLMVLTLACERNSRPIGGATGAVDGSPQYSAAPDVSASSGLSTVASVSVDAGQGPDGAALYAQNCAACHQVTGQGVPSVFPPLDGSPYVTGDKVDRMASIMIYGLLGPINVNGTQYNSAMAPLGRLKDAELAAIGTYIRSSWSNKAGAVDEAVFAAARQKWGARGPFQISELGEEK